MARVRSGAGSYPDNVRCGSLSHDATQLETDLSRHVRLSRVQYRSSTSTRHDIERLRRFGRALQSCSLTHANAQQPPRAEAAARVQRANHTDRHGLSVLFMHLARENVRHFPLRVHRRGGDAEYLAPCLGLSHHLRRKEMLRRRLTSGVLVSWTCKVPCNLTCDRGGCAAAFASPYSSEAALWLHVRTPDLTGERSRTSRPYQSETPCFCLGVHRRGEHRQPLLGWMSKFEKLLGLGGEELESGRYPSIC